MGLLRDEIRAGKDAMRYGFAAGKVAVLQTRRLDQAFVERLADAREFKEQRRLLADTSYGRFIEGARTAEDVERGLDEALASAYGFLVEADLPEAVVRFFRLRYDFANLKAIAKARLLEVSSAGMLLAQGNVDVQAFEKPLERLPGALGETARHLPLTSSDETGEVDTRLIDTIVDRGMFAEMLETAEASKSEFLVDYTKLSIDLANIRTIVRARRAGLASKVIGLLLFEGGGIPLSKLEPLRSMSPAEMPAAIGRMKGMKALADAPLDDTAALDSSLDAVRSIVLRRGRLGRIGPEPVISYVMAREAEITALRMVLLGRLAGLSSETLRKHVRVIR